MSKSPFYICALKKAYLSRKGDITTIDNLIFVDGEERFTNKRDQVLQNRPMLLKGFIGGREINDTENSQYELNQKLITPTLREILRSTN